MVLRRLLKQWSEPLQVALCLSLRAVLEQDILGGSSIFYSSPNWMTADRRPG